MRDEPERTCLKCDYWFPNLSEKEPYNDLTCGSCHRRPPSVPLVAERGQFYEEHEQGSTVDQTLMGFPETYGDEWCGEWRPDKNARLEGFIGGLHQ